MLGVTEETLFTVEYDVDAKEIKVIPLSEELCDKITYKKNKREIKWK